MFLNTAVKNMSSFIRLTRSHLFKLIAIQQRHCRSVTNVSKETEHTNIRNIGIIAHIDAGKTTTTERMLYYSGFTPTMGEVHDGDTIMDYLPQERERGITITSAAITFKWKKHKINLIDTPGHVDFTIEVERSLCALDGCIVILDSSAGVQVQTLTVWKQANQHNVPCIMYLNKMDKQNSNFSMSINSISEKLKTKPLVLHYPLNEGKNFAGVLDIIKKCKYIWENIGSLKDGKKFKSHELSNTEKDFVESKRTELIETVADLDDTFANKFILEGFESLTDEDLISAIKRITIKKSAVPVLCGSSYKNIGVQLLMDAILEFLPNPYEKINRKLPIFENELCALAFKIIHDKKRGPLTFLRLYSGEIKSGQKLYYANSKKSEKVGSLMVPFADSFTEVSSVLSGNIAVVTGLKESMTGDTLLSTSNTSSENDSNTLLLQVPDPVFFCTIESPSPKEQNDLESALQRMTREDPTFQVEHDHELGQIIISGMGELHIQILKDRISKEYGIDACLGPLQVAYRETLVTESVHTHILDKNLGGVKNYVKIMMSVYPFRDSGKFKEVKVVVTKENELGKIRSDHLKFINNGIQVALTHGPIVGFPVIDVKVSLLWLEVSKGTTGSMITAAASQCIQHLLKISRVHLLEPVMSLYITAAPGYAGRIVNDLSQRRSEILDVQSLVDMVVIQTLTPLSQLRGYSTTLRAITGGTCSFTMELDSYAKMDLYEQAKAVEEVTGFSPI